MRSLRHEETKGRGNVRYKNIQGKKHVRSENK